MHKVVLAEREWLSVLTAINASGQWIPNYYILKEVRKLGNYVIKYEKRAMHGMQKKGWINSFHFMEWMNHFINRIKEEGVPPIGRHLLILDGHKSHLSLEVLESKWD